jgi:hypothetical protein
MGSDEAVVRLWHEMTGTPELVAEVTLQPARSPSSVLL